jgi:hypothetical protein
LRNLILAPLILFARFSGAQIMPGSGAAVTLPELQLRGSPATMFAMLVHEAGLSGGVVSSNQGCSRPPARTVNIKAGTEFENAIALVAKFGSKPKWIVQDGVAVFLPDGMVPPLLQVQIQSFTLDKTEPFSELLDRIRQLPEVTEAARKFGLTEAPFEGGPSTICLRGNCGGETQIQPIVQTEQSLSVFSLLNRVAKAHKSVWDYSEFRCERGMLFSFSVLMAERTNATKNLQGP